jgi:hypothetical protein
MKPSVNNWEREPWGKHRGKRTPGVDKILLDTPGKKWQQAQRLNVRLQNSTIKAYTCPQEKWKTAPVRNATLQGLVKNGRKFLLQAKSRADKL